MDDLKDLTRELKEWRTDTESEARRIAKKQKDLVSFFRKQILSDRTSVQDDEVEGKVRIETRKMFQEFVSSGRVEQFTQRHFRVLSSMWTEFDVRSFKSLLSKSELLQRHWVKRYLKTYPEALIGTVREAKINGVIDRESSSALLLEGLNLGHVDLPLSVVRDHRMKADHFIDPAQSAKFRWFRFGDEFSRCLIGALIFELAKEGKEKDLGRFFDALESSDEGEHLRLADLKGIKAGVPIKLSQKWWVIGLLGVAAHSKGYRAKALRLLSSLGRTELGDPRSRLNKRNWEFIQGIAKRELQLYMSSLNSADLEFFFDLQEVEMKEVRADFWRPYISKAEWTQVVFDPSVFGDLRRRYTGEEQQAIIERAFVFGARSSHHAIIMGFKDVVVIVAHTTGAKQYLVGREFFENRVASLFEDSQKAIYGSQRSHVVQASSFGDIRSLLNRVIDRGDVDDPVHGVIQKGAWQGKARELLRNEFGLVARA